MISSIPYCCDTNIYCVYVSLDPRSIEPKAHSTSWPFPENLELSSTTTLSKLTNYVVTWLNTFTRCLLILGIDAALKYNCVPSKRLVNIFAHYVLPATIHCQSVYLVYIMTMCYCCCRRGFYTNDVNVLSLRVYVQTRPGSFYGHIGRVHWGPDL